MGRLDEAERTLSDVLRRRLAVLGPTHPDTPPTYRALGLVYLRQGRMEQIEQLYDEALQTLPPGSKQVRDRLAQEIEQFRAMRAEESETLGNLPFLPYE
jgi:Tfp pilus assembly protein PilF